MNKSIIILITLISAQLCTAQILSISPIIGGKIECARFNYRANVPINSLIESRAPVFSPMRSVLFGINLNYENKRNTFGLGIILNEQVHTTIIHSFPVIIDNQKILYEKRYNLGEKLIKIPLTYRLAFLKNNGEHANLSLLTGANLIFFNKQTNGIKQIGSTEIFTLDDGTIANNLSVETYQYELNGGKLNLSLELGLAYKFKIGQKHHLITSLSYEQGVRFLTQSQTIFTYFNGSKLSNVNSSRGSSFHLKLMFPLNIKSTK
jgi:hypothetical protein